MTEDDLLDLTYAMHALKDVMNIYHRNGLLSVGFIAAGLCGLIAKTVEREAPEGTDAHTEAAGILDYLRRPD